MASERFEPSAWVAFAFVCVVARPCAAQTEFARLTIDADRVACLSPPLVERDVEAVVHRDVFGEHGQLEVVLARAGPTLTIRVIGPAAIIAERELPWSDDCDLIRGRAAVVIAMLLDGLTTPEPSTAPDARTPPERVAVPPPERVAVSAPVELATPPPEPAPGAPSSRVWVGATLSGSLRLGTMPDATAGLLAEGLLGERGGVNGGLGLVLVPVGSARGTPGAELSAMGVRGLVCTPATTDLRPVRLAGCVGTEALLFRAVGVRVEAAYERLEALWSVEGTLEITIDLFTPLALHVRVGLGVPVVRPWFFALVHGEQVLVHEPWPVLPVLAVGTTFADPW